MYSPIHEIILGGLITMVLMCGVIWFTSGEDPAPTPNPIYKRLVLEDVGVDTTW